MRAQSTSHNAADTLDETVVGWESAVHDGVAATAAHANSVDDIAVDWEEVAFGVLAADDIAIASEVR